MLNPPIQYVCGLPVSKWQEGSHKIIALLCNGKFKYKATCTKCKCSSRGETYLMRSISNHLQENKPCQH